MLFTTLHRQGRCIAITVVRMGAASFFIGVTEAPINGAPTPSDSGIQAVETNPTTVFPKVTIAADLDEERERIAPSLGAVSYTIGRNQIQSMGGGENSSFQQIVLHAPGVVQDGFGEVHVRGDHGNVQYRINGVLLPQGLNGFGQEIDPHLIDSVTLITGTLPAQFGERTAGIFDIQTKSGGQLSGNELSFYGGSYDTFHPSATFGGATSKLDYFVNASYRHNNLGIDNTTSSETPVHDDTDQENLFGYFSHVFDPTSRITLLVCGSHADFEIPTTPGLSPLYTLVNGPQADASRIHEIQNEQNRYAALSYQKSAGNLSAQFSLLTRYSGIHFSPDPAQDLLFNGNAADVRTSDFANGFQADGSYPLGDYHIVRTGMLVTHAIERLDNESQVFPTRSRFAPSGASFEEPPVPIQSSVTPETIRARARNRGLTFASYIQDEWQPTDGLTLNYGLRFDRFDATFDCEEMVSPRANLVWKIGDRTSTHIGYARYFQPPTLQHVPSLFVSAFEYTTDAPFNAGNDPQKCERDHYFDVGISRQLTTSWQVTVDGFYKQAKNLLDDGQFGTAIILNNFNYSDASVYGGELSSIYQHAPFSAYGNFSYVQTHAREISSAQNEFPNNELTYIAQNDIQLDHQGEFTGSAGVAYTFLKDIHLHSDFLYGYGLRSGFANLAKQPSYWTVNVGVEHVWRFQNSSITVLKLRLDCLNLFDTIYELRNGSGLGVAAAAFGSRRGIYGGVTVVF